MELTSVKVVRDTVVGIASFAFYMFLWHTFPYYVWSDLVPGLGLIVLVAVPVLGGLIAAFYVVFLAVNIAKRIISLQLGFPFMGMHLIMWGVLWHRVYILFAYG